MPTVSVAHCLVCDSVRQEAYGKISIVGLYGFAPDVQLGFSAFNQPANSFLFVLFLEGKPGVYQFEASIISPSKKNLQTIKLAALELIEKHRAVALVDFAGLKIPEAGDYTFELTEGKKTIYSTTFHAIVVDPHTIYSKTGTLLDTGSIATT